MTSPVSPGPDGDPPRAHLYWSAVWRAAVSCATFAVPVAILQIWLIDSDRIQPSDSFNLILYFVIMCCGALGGYAAAKLAPAFPLQNGAAAAGLAVIGIQVGGAIRRAIAGDSLPNPIATIFLALLMATFGMFGAWVDTKTRPTSTRPSENGTAP